MQLSIQSTTSYSIHYVYSGILFIVSCVCSFHGVVVLGAINSWSLKVTAWLTAFLSLAKVLALGFIIILGIWQLIVGGVAFIYTWMLLLLKWTQLAINTCLVDCILLLIIWSCLPPHSEHLENFTDAFSCITDSPGEIALAFYSVLWAYDGW